MTYTFVGEKDFLDREISKISKDFSSENIVNYNLSEDNINSVIQDLNTVSLFGKKLIIVNNIDKLEEFEELENYLSNPSDNVLILLSFKELDKRKKSTKVIVSKTKYKELFNYDVSKVIKDNLDGFKMLPMASNLLINYCNGNINRIENELEKLKMYKIDEKEITRDDVDKLVKKSLDSTIFDLIDKINQNDKNSIFKIYNELVEEGETEEKIMYTIANHYRLLFQISERIKTNTDNEIIAIYKMHPYRLTKLKEQVSIVSQNEILKILKKLSDIDIGIKKGEADIKNSMFLFFETL